MRQFYEAYRGDEKISPLVRQLPWTHHLIILSQARLPEVRHFYILAAVKERWSKRELERQIRTGAALRGTAAKARVSPALSEVHSTAVTEFKNEYNLEFLSLPTSHSEADLHDALLRDLGRFISELREKLNELYAQLAPVGATGAPAVKKVAGDSGPARRSSARHSVRGVG